MEEASHLPEAIIHHILSYLNPKQKAQVAVLSKEWLNAWQTNPNLEFDDRYFGSASENYHRYEEGKQKFIKHVNSTLARYQEGLIQELSLTLIFDDTDDSASFLREKLETAVQKSVKLVRLVICGRNYDYIWLQSILVSKLLTDLHVRRCKLKKQINGRLFCYNIRSLRLEQVYIDDEMFGCFISGGPLINDLIIVSCKGLNTIKVINLLRLKQLRIHSLTSMNPTIEVDAPSLESMDLQYLFGQRFLKLHASESLKDLCLANMDITDEFFDNFVNKFPSLEFLKVDSCFGLDRINLTSHSVKHMRLFSSSETMEVEIVAPNLIKFDYGGHSILQHGFSFRGVFSGQCAFNISTSFLWYSRDHAAFFLKLHQLLSNCSPSKVSLRLTCYLYFQSHKYTGNIPTCANPNAIEGGELDLYIFEKSSTREKSDFLDVLFWNYRPKTIVLHGMLYDSDQFIEFLYQKLITERRNRKFYNWPRTTKFWEHELKKVEFVIYDRSGRKYCQQEPLDYHSLEKVAPKILFKLEWDVNCTSRKTQESEALKLESVVGKYLFKFFDSSRDLFKSFLK